MKKKITFQESLLIYSFSYENVPCVCVCVLRLNLCVSTDLPIFYVKRSLDSNGTVAVRERRNWIKRQITNEIISNSTVYPRRQWDWMESKCQLLLKSAAPQIFLWGKCPGILRLWKDMKSAIKSFISVPLMFIAYLYNILIQKNCFALGNLGEISNSKLNVL